MQYAAVQIGSGIIKQVAEVYRKIRGTLRFLLGNLSDYDPATDAVPYEQLPGVDKYVLARYAALMTDVQEAYEAYQVRAWLVPNAIVASRVFEIQ